jgi:hypothetical protein
VPLACQLTTACDGTLTLQTGAGKISKTLGSANFSIPAGTSQDVSVHLNKSGRKLVKRHKKVTVTAVTSVGGVNATFQVKLKR